MSRWFLVLLAACSSLVFLASPASAKAAAPHPTPSPIAGFSAHGTLSVDATFGEAPMTFTAELAVMDGKRHVRVDLLNASLAVQRSNGASPSATTPPLMHGAVTLVYDQNSRTTTIWSVERHLYYQSKPSKSQKPRPGASPKPSAGLFTLDRFLKSMQSMTQYDSFTESLSLVGHEMINGQMASHYHFTSQARKHGETAETTSGDLAFADNLSGIPIRLWITATGTHSGGLKVDLTSVSLAPPKDSAFVVPEGYRKTNDLMTVLGIDLLPLAQSVVPAPSPSP